MFSSTYLVSCSGKKNKSVIVRNKIQVHFFFYPTFFFPGGKVASLSLPSPPPFAPAALAAIAAGGKKEKEEKRKKVRSCVSFLQMCQNAALPTWTKRRREKPTLEGKCWNLQSPFSSSLQGISPPPPPPFPPPPPPPPPPLLLPAAAATVRTRNKWVPLSMHSHLSLPKLDVRRRGRRKAEGDDFPFLNWGLIGNTEGSICLCKKL